MRSAGERYAFLLETASLSVLSSYHGVAAMKRWNAPLLPGGTAANP